MTDNPTISSLLSSLNKYAANARKWQGKAATQAIEIKRLSETVQRLRKDKLQLLADLKKAQSDD